MKQLSMGAAILGAALIAGPDLVYAQQAEDIGKVEFVTNCAVCHGTDAKGKGPIVGWLGKRSADLTTLQKNNKSIYPFDRVYKIIDGREDVAAHGPRDMPIWGAAYNREAWTKMYGLGSPEAAESYVQGRIVALAGYIFTLQEK